MTLALQTINNADPLDYVLKGGKVNLQQVPTSLWNLSRIYLRKMFNLFQDVHCPLCLSYKGMLQKTH